MVRIVSTQPASFTMRMPVRPRGQERARVVRSASGVRAYTPNASANAQREIRELWLLAGRPCVPEGAAFRAEICATFKRPKAHAGRRDVRGPRPDVDNIAKLVLDALQGHAFADDTDCHALTVEKRWGEADEVAVTLAW